jgi:hypothetical protein
VLEINNKLVPGIIHTVILSEVPLARSYKRHAGINVDVNILDVGEFLGQFLTESGFTHVSLLRDVIVEGNSWEMSAVHGALGFNGIYSGSIKDYVLNEYIEFDHVPGLSEKRKLSKSLVTAYERPMLLLSR